VYLQLRRMSLKCAKIDAIGSTRRGQKETAVDLWESVVMWMFRHFGGLTGAVLPPVRRIAQDVIGEIAHEGLPLSDEEKRRTAFFRIQRRAIDTQIPWAPHVINLAIELAVADLKRHRRRVKQSDAPLPRRD
jgi:hypothetical protein